MAGISKRLQTGDGAKHTAIAYPWHRCRSGVAHEGIMACSKTTDRHFHRLIALVFALVCVVSSCGTLLWAAPVDLASARRVAEAEIQRHIDLYGAWGAAPSASVGAGETVWLDGQAVAHHFSVQPAGHVLVAADDRFSPVLLYSPTSTFDPARVTDPTGIEAWVLPEILKTLENLENDASAGYRALGADPAAADAAARISSAWSLYLASSATATRSLAAAGERLDEGLIVGPLLVSRWGQGQYYNAEIPAVGGACDHALTGCVATAFAQLMRYWQWPFSGEGDYSYQWAGQTVSADFEIPYDWDLMPDSLSSNSTADQVTAVAHLMADVAVAVETDFGCSGSSSTRYGDEILDRFFRYKSLMARHSRSHYDAAGWFGLIQSELDAQPPRPMLFSIFTDDWSGHEVVIDGYETGPTDMVHINLGWSGAYNGYYDVTHDFTAAYEWRSDYQVLVTGIEPDNTPPVVDAGEDQLALMGQVVTLGGSAVDPDGFDLSRIRWIQRSGPLVALSNAQALQPTFSAPPVTAETDLAFELVVDDAQGSQVSDTCTITIYPPLDHPVAMAGTDRTVTPGSQVTLTGSAVAADGQTIQSYAWLPPSDQRAVSLTAEDAIQTSFIAPDVTSETELVFTFQVTDSSGQTAEDDCVITVSADAATTWGSGSDGDPDSGDTPTVNNTGGRSSSGGGPCFIQSLRP
jgi:hypothetical protein